MIKNIYVINDLKTTYLDPIVCDNDSLAIRSMEICFARGNNDMAFAPQDFRLCKIGTYDNVLGIITPCDMEVIFDGKDLVK